MEIITYIICGIGIYLLAYQNHCGEVNRYMEQQEKEALEENKHRIEEHIKELHHNGHIFGDSNHERII